MELRHIKYFLAVADELSFTKAAIKVGIGQPPLSMQIKNLEDEIGTALFRRTSHGVELTEAGLAFQVHALRTIDSAGAGIDAARQVARGDMGQLRMGFTASAAFNPVVSVSIQQFRLHYPRVNVSLVDANSVDLFAQMEAAHLDAAFVRPGPAISDAIALRHLAPEAMKIAVPHTHALANQRIADIAALAHEPFVMFPRSNGTALYDEVTRACREAGFEPQIAQQAPQLSSVVNLVAAGLGVAIVPAAIAQIQLAGVRYLEICGAAPQARLAIAYRAHDGSSVARNFLAMQIL